MIHLHIFPYPSGSSSHSGLCLILISSERSSLVTHLKYHSTSHHVLTYYPTLFFLNVYSTKRTFIYLLFAAYYVPPLECNTQGQVSSFQSTAIPSATGPVGVQYIFVE